MKRIVIIGGGITGLTTMYDLQRLKNQQNLDIEIVLVEKNDHLGGKIHTVEQDDFLMETGADSIVTRNESVAPLVNDLELEDEVVYNATGSSYLYSHGALHKIPEDTIFGIPTNVDSLFSSTLVSQEGKERALQDLESENSAFTVDSPIGPFLKTFLGDELVENQIAPVLSGVYSGDLDKLTLATTLPYLVDYKNRYGSIIKGLGANKERFQKSGNKKFLSFRNGLSTIIDRLEEKVSESTILKGTTTTSIQKMDEKYMISFDNHEEMEADYVVLATPHDVAQAIIKDSTLDQHFNQMKNSSLTSVYIGFDVPDEELPANGTGFIVSNGSDLSCNACTWSSRKWTHTSKKRRLLVRLFYKSTNPAYERLIKLPKEAFIEEALSDVKRSLGIETSPASVEVTYWNNLMPNYTLDHKQALQSLTEEMKKRFPNILLAGCSYYGVGIGACIQNGRDTAKDIHDSLTRL
ncbi:protoporphyrinogen oxidase [Priestia koreensis]|uniref:protoporphyrinogen oxidase n=1 Tax=Priestia koreensis TaxID=284581 RepID=UPI00345A9D47